MRVPLTGTGTSENPFRPDLPDGVIYTVVERHGDGTVTVDVGDYEFRLRLSDAEKPVHVPEWVAPTGAHDAPNIGDHRWHDSQVWRSLIDGNTTVPGSDPRWWETTVPPAIPDTLRDPLRALRPAVESAADVTQLRTAVLDILDTLTGDR